MSGNTNQFLVISEITLAALEDTGYFTFICCVVFHYIYSNKCLLYDV